MQVFKEENAKKYFKRLVEVSKRPKEQWKEKRYGQGHTILYRSCFIKILPLGLYDQ